MREVCTLERFVDLDQHGFLSQIDGAQIRADQFEVVHGQRSRSHWVNEKPSPKEPPALRGSAPVSRSPTHMHGMQLKHSRRHKVGEENRRCAAPPCIGFAHMRVIGRIPGSSIRHLEQPVVLRLERLVHLQGVSSPFRADDCEVTAAAANNPGLPQRMGDDRHRVALHADHLRQDFLRQRRAGFDKDSSLTSSPI